MARKNEIPQLKARGVYAADTIGNGTHTAPLLQLPMQPFETLCSNDLL